MEYILAPEWNPYFDEETANAVRAEIDAIVESNPGRWVKAGVHGKKYTEYHFLSKSGERFVLRRPRQQFGGYWSVHPFHKYAVTKPVMRGKYRDELTERFMLAENK